MELFKLKTEKRNKLYFNKFMYKAVCKIQGAAYTYYTSEIDSFISRMEKFRETERSKFGVRILDDDWQEYWEEVNIEQIAAFITWRNMISKDRCLIRIQQDNVSFFSNELSLLQTLDNLDPKLKFHQAICHDPKTLYFKRQPKYKFRTYFKSRRMPKDFSDNVRSLNKIYKSLNFSKGLISNLFNNNWHPYRYMHGSFFVEYNDEQMITILGMWFSDMLGKTYTLAKEQ